MNRTPGAIRGVAGAFFLISAPEACEVRGGVRWSGASAEGAAMSPVFIIAVFPT